METRVQAHVAYRLLYHLVWIPKYRRKVLVRGISEYCEKVIRDVVIERYPDIFIEEINVQIDHIHLVVVIPPKYSISAVVGKLKSESSKRLRGKFEYLRRGIDSLWSIGYFISSVGLDEKRIRSYVHYQEEQDKGQLKAVFDKDSTGKAKRRP